MTTQREDLYSKITATIVTQLEAGCRPWHQPWNAAHAAGGISRPLRYNGQPYNGVNVLVLWLTAFQKGYSCPLWLTFQQAKQLGGNVKRGEKGTMVVYANTFEKKEKDEETGEETTERIPFLKSYVVFNAAEQTEGLPGHYYARAAAPRNLAERLEHAEQFFANTKADTRHGGNRAFYSPSGDFIQLPPYDSFESRDSYFATRCHESIHWSGSVKRLSRSFESKRFGDDGYAVEELVVRRARRVCWSVNVVHRAAGRARVRPTYLGPSGLEPGNRRGTIACREQGRNGRNRCSPGRSAQDANGER